MFRFLFITALLCAAGFVRAQAASASATLNLTDCFIGDESSGISVAAQCGRLTVPENRKNPDSRLIKLNVAVVNSDVENPKSDAVVLLAGGPGQGAVDTFAVMARNLSQLLPKHRIVMVDQRGTGESHPLRCDYEMDDFMDVTDWRSPEVVQWMKDCHASLDADTRFYTTTIAIEDLESVRQALGIEQWNIYGGSYGTRKGLTYMKLYPDSIRTAILDGVMPQQEAMASAHEVNLQNTLKNVFRLCREDATCQERFGDAEQQMWAFLQSLEEQPIEMRLPNPVSGEYETFELTRDFAVLGLRMFAYSPETMGMIPLLVSLANHEQPENLAQQAFMVTSSLTENLNNALELSVVCAEDVPFLPKEQNTQNSLFGDEFYEMMRSRCEYWDSEVVDASFKDPVESDIPTLLLSGEYDPVTPPAFAEKALETLSNAQHLVAQGQGHIVANRGCMPKIVTAFIEEPEQELETECMNNFNQPAFFINLNGPQQ
ncbi:MAG: alpha/beta hydrolase [Marinicella pacifica]